MKSEHSIKWLGTILLALFLANFGLTYFTVRAGPNPQRSETSHVYLPQLRKFCNPSTFHTKTTRFYRVRVDLSTTSDWSEIRFQDATDVLTYQLMQVTGSPTFARVESDATSPLLMVILQPVDQAGIEMGMVMDVALSEAVAGQTINFLFRKGGLNESTVRFSLVNGEDLFPIFEMSQTAEQMPFEVDFSVLSQYPPAQGHTHKPCPMTWAIYYGWFREEFYPRDWSSDIWTDKPAELYSTDDPQAIARQITQAKGAGIDGFLIE